MKFNMKIKKNSLLVAILLSFLILSTQIAQAEVSDTVPSKPSTSFFGVFNLKQLLFKSVEQKREYLEKNRDIRNKMVDERISPKTEEKLNIKFNIYNDHLINEELLELLAKLESETIKLESIHDRVLLQLNRLDSDTRNIDLSKELSALATSTLELHLARTYINHIDTLNSTTTPKEELASSTAYHLQNAKKSLMIITSKFGESESIYGTTTVSR
jgi:hypothetical protein